MVHEYVEPSNATRKIIDAVENGWLILNSPFLLEKVKSFERKLIGLRYEQD